MLEKNTKMLHNIMNHTLNRLKEKKKVKSQQALLQKHIYSTTKINMIYSLKQVVNPNITLQIEKVSTEDI